MFFIEADKWQRYTLAGKAGWSSSDFGSVWRSEKVCREEDAWFAFGLATLQDVVFVRLCFRKRWFFLRKRDEDFEDEEEEEEQAPTTVQFCHSPATKVHHWWFFSIQIPMDEPQEPRLWWCCGGWERSLSLRSSDFVTIFWFHGVLHDNVQCASSMAWLGKTMIQQY